MALSLEKEDMMGLLYMRLEKKLLNSFWENWEEVEFRQFFTYFQPILTFLEWFNQKGAYTVEGCHDGLSFAVIRRKVTE